MSTNNAGMTFSGDSSAAQSAIAQVGAMMKDLVVQMGKMTAEGRKGAGEYSGAWKKANAEIVRDWQKELGEYRNMSQGLSATTKETVVNIKDEWESLKTHQGKMIFAGMMVREEANAQILKDEIELNELLYKIDMEAAEADMKFELQRSKNTELANAQILKDEIQTKAQRDAINAKTFSSYSNYNQRRLEAQQQLNAMLWKEEQEQAVKIESVHAKTLRGGMGRGWSAAAAGAGGASSAVSAVIAQSGNLNRSNRLLQQGMTQLSFAADDVMQTFSTMGASGAIRSSANNISTFITMINPLYGILATIGLGAAAYFVKGMENAGKAVKDTSEKTKDAIEEYKKSMKTVQDEIDKIRGEKKVATFDVDEISKFDKAVEMEKAKLATMQSEFKQARSPTGGAFWRGLVRVWDDDAYKESDKKEKAAIEEQKKRVQQVENDKQKFKGLAHARDDAERKAFAEKEDKEADERFRKRLPKMVERDLGIVGLKKGEHDIRTKMANINKATQEEIETIGQRRDIGPEQKRRDKIEADTKRDELIAKQTKALEENTVALQAAQGNVEGLVALSQQMEMLVGINPMAGLLGAIPGVFRPTPQDAEAK